MTGIVIGLALLLGAATGWAGVIACLGVFGAAVLGGGRRAAWTAALIPAALLGCLRVHDAEPLSVPGLPAGETSITGRVDSGPIENGRRQRFDLAVDAGRDGDPFRLCVSAPLVPVVGFRDRVDVAGNVQWFDDVDERNADYLRSRGCAGSLTASELAVMVKGTGPRAWLDGARRDLTDSLRTAAPGDAGALLTGLVTGDDSALPSDRRLAFIVTGTSHVTAVSGSNLAVILAIFTVAGTAAGFGRAWPWQALTVGALWLYVGLIGPSPPPLRAALVASLAVVALWFGRRPDFVTLSVIVAAAEVTLRPGDIESLAFRLSTVSTIALVLGLAGRTPSGFRGWLSHGIFATATTQAATSPLLIPVFGRLSLYAIPANLVIASLCAFAFPLALVAGLAGMVSPTLGAAIAAPATVPASLALWTAEFFAGLPRANAGSTIAEAVPEWGWLFLGIAAVLGLSKECRGGIVRVVSVVSSLDARPRAVIAGATAGALAGLAASSWLR